MPDKNEKFVKEFEDYINKFEKIRELAQRFKTSPGSVMEMFFSIGLEALRQTESIMKNEFESKLKEIFPEGVPSEVKSGITFKKIILAIDNIDRSGGFANMKGKFDGD